MKNQVYSCNKRCRLRVLQLGSYSEKRIMIYFLCEMSSTIGNSDLPLSFNSKENIDSGFFIYNWENCAGSTSFPVSEHLSNSESCGFRFFFAKIYSQILISSVFLSSFGHWNLGLSIFVGFYLILSFFPNNNACIAKPNYEYLATIMQWNFYFSGMAILLPSLM